MSKVRRVGVIGAGTIGTAWAVLFAVQGIEVRVYDSHPAVLERTPRVVGAILKSLGQAGLRVDPADGMKHLEVVGSLEEAVEDAEWVQESVVETYEAKQEVFRRADLVVPTQTILASSSSGLSMTRVQAAVTQPGRCLIAHPFNPPYLIPLVELVPGEKTTASTLKRARAFMTQLGKTPVVLHREAPGYLANRLAAALWREAIDLVRKGVASVADVDRAVTAGLGPRWALMGPHLVYHLGGGRGGIKHFVEHLGPAFESWWSSMDSWVTLPEGVAELLEDGLQEEIGTSDINDLMVWRDRRLLELLRVIESPS